jgi:hypothetical protein
MFLVLMFMVAWVAQDLQNHVHLTFQATLPIWRGLALVILCLWGWAINVYLFQRYRINAEFIFEINPRTELKFEQLLLVAATLSTLWFVLLDLHFFVSLVKSAGAWSEAVTGWLPFTLFVVFFFICFMPFDVFFRPTRWYILRTLYKIVTAPFHPVDFKDFYVADQLCSLVNVFNDIMYSFCYLTTGHFTTMLDADPRCIDVQNTAVWLLACLPSWWRLLQCLRKYRDNPPANTRQLWNSCKYTAAICTTLLSLLNKNYPGRGFQPVWITVAALTTLFSYSWDVYCDWGFLRFEVGEFTPKLLRRKLVLNNHLPYYFAIVSNLALRVAWVFSISPNNFGLNLRSDVFNTIVWALEIVRRNQ